MQTNSSDPKTIEDCITRVEEQLLEANVYFGHGADNATDEAIRLIWYCLKLPVDTDDSCLQRHVTAAELKQINSLLAERIDKHKPLAYLTHEAWFMGLPFYVDERVLIPRSPFAELIAKQFQPWVDPDNVRAILEIGTGSGCMAIAAATVFNQAQVDAVDINLDALEVAKINVDQHKLAQRVHLICSDCYTQLPAKKYDMIISNPPYVSVADMQVLPPEYLTEPVSALQAQQDGLAIVHTILQQAVNFLQPTGVLVVEVGCSQEALLQAYPTVPFLWLELACGGDGIFLLDYPALMELNVAS